MQPDKQAYFLKLSHTAEYKETWELQRVLVRARVNNVLSKDIFISLEHQPVFTMGRRGGTKHLNVSESFLNEKGIGLFHIERGGEITYHGPGQLIVYPIIDLKMRKIKVVDFIEILEEIMIGVLADWGIRGERNKRNRGVWIGSSKIGSVGIAIRKGVSFHGLALNVNTGLEPFCWINPCGLEGVPIVSMKKLIGMEINMTEIHRSITNHVKKILQLDLLPIQPQTLLHMLDTPKTGKISRK